MFVLVAYVQERLHAQFDFFNESGRGILFLCFFLAKIYFFLIFLLLFLKIYDILYVDFKFGFFVVL